MSHFENHFYERRKQRTSKWSSYFKAYDRHLTRFINSNPFVLEIGVAGGGSLHFWRNSLGPGTRVVGIDIDPSCLAHSCPEREICVEIGDSKNSAFVDSVIEKYGNPDIIIDDGEHNSPAMIATLSNLWHTLNDSGIYIIEDLHGVFWQDTASPDTSIFSLINNEILGLNAPGSRGHVNQTNLSSSLESITCHWSLFFLEKTTNRVVPEAVATENGSTSILTRAL